MKIKILNLTGLDTLFFSNFFHSHLRMRIQGGILCLGKQEITICIKNYIANSILIIFFFLNVNKKKKKILFHIEFARIFRYLRFHILSIFSFQYLSFFFQNSIFKSWNNAEFKCLFLYFFSIV
ncbi:hypothetical protein ACJX0J_001592 [Zea mays]